MIQWAEKLQNKQGGGGISASAPRPHGTSEGSNTGKLIPADRKEDDSIRGKKSKNSGGVGRPPMMIEQLGAKNLKSSGRMMIEKVMIQIGAKNQKIAAAPPTMIEKVMIQEYKKAAGRSSVPLRQGLMVQVRIQSRAN